MADYTATGGGNAAYNGDYTQNGTYNGQPAYENANGRWLYWATTVMADSWVMCGTKSNGFDTLDYACYAATGITSTWYTGSGGECLEQCDPAPTVAAAGGAGVEVQPVVTTLVASAPTATATGGAAVSAAVTVLALSAPAAVAAGAVRFSFLEKRNNAGTTLTADVAAGDLTVTVAAAAVLPLATPFLITVYRTLPTDGTMEIMRVTNIAANVLTVIRAQEGTAAVAHLTADVAWSYPTAATWEELEDAINTVAADYLRRDGTLDLTGDWTIAANDVTLTAGILGAADIYKGGDPYSDRTLLAFDYIGGFEGTNPVIACGGGAEWDEHIREIGNVLYEPTDTGKEYKIFYSGYNGAYVQNTVYIGYAYSSDGISWTKAGQVIVRSLEDPYVVNVSGTYHLYAEDKTGAIGDIRKYHSSDCVVWVDDGVVLSPVPATWESDDVSSPVVWLEGATWYMLYEGRETLGQRGAVGLATSADGSTWAKEATNPVFEGSDIDWADRVVPDDVRRVSGVYYLTLHAYNGAEWRAGMAVSSNLTLWNDYYGTSLPIEAGSASTVMMTYSKQYIMYYGDYAEDTGIRRGYPMSTGYWDRVTGGIRYPKGNLTIADGEIDFGSDVNLYRGAANILKTDDSLHVDGTLGIGIAPVSGKGINLNETALDTASGYYAGYIAFCKSAGGSDHNDRMRALYLYARMNQAGGEISYLQGIVIQTTMDAGNVGDAVNSRDVMAAYLLAQLSGGKVWGNAYGAHIWLDQAGANEVTGDVYGLHVEADLDGTVGGTAYMCYLKEDDGVDYGFYQDGAAANVLGGTLLMLDKIMFTQVDGDEYIDSLADGYIDYRATTAHRFGDGANQLLISAAGVLTLEGTAERILTLRPEVNVDEVKKQTVPVQVQVGAGAAFGYTMPVYAADHEELYFRQNVPGRWDEASDIILHVLVCLSQIEDAGDNFKFQLSWNHTEEDEPVPVGMSAEPTVETTVLAGRLAQYDAYELEFTIDYDVDGVGHEIVAHDLLSMRLRRQDATDPDVTGNIIVLDWHTHYEVDKMFKAP